MDIGYIIKNVRVMRYFLKTVLDKDQRVLLKLKSTEYIDSSEDENKADPFNERKKKRKNIILDRYIDFVMRKPLGK